MIFENEFDYIIPLGFNCNSANACKIAGVRQEKLPFDWMQIKGLIEPNRFLAYHKMLQDMYNNCLEFNIVKHKTDEFSILNYKAWIPHEQGNCDCDGIKEKYIKYFGRLKTILESNKKILIIMSEMGVTDYNENLVEIQNNYLKNLYPNNDYYFLTININNRYINTTRHLNMIINEKGHHVNGVWTDPFLAKSVEICKNIKIKNNTDENSNEE
jgi:hypothetical protein